MKEILPFTIALMNLEDFMLVIPVAQMVKNLPAMQEIQVRSLGQEDPLEKEMAIHSSVLAWKIPWTEESGGLQCMGSQRVGHDWATNTTTYTKWNKPDRDRQILFCLIYR